MEEKKKMLIKAESEVMRSGDNSRVRGLKAEINILSNKETRMWNQISRILWLTKGDNNSKYFPSKLTKQFKKNSIKGLRDEAGL